MIQCSCCGAVGKYYGDCSNCWGCGPGGQQHDTSKEVWSQDREDRAEAELECAREDYERIKGQRPSTSNPSLFEPEVKE